MKEIAVKRLRAGSSLSTSSSRSVHPFSLYKCNRETEPYQLIGSSSFLDESDGGFYVAVEDKADTRDQQFENDVVDDRSEINSDEINEVSSEDRPEISPAILKSFIGSFGPLRSFKETEGCFGNKQVNLESLESVMSLI